MYKGCIKDKCDGCSISLPTSPASHFPSTSAGVVWPFECPHLHESAWYGSSSDLAGYQETTRDTPSCWLFIVACASKTLWTSCLRCFWKPMGLWESFFLLPWDSRPIFIGFLVLTSLQEWLRGSHTSFSWMLRMSRPRTSCGQKALITCHHDRTSEDRSFVHCKLVSTKREDTQTEAYLWSGVLGPKQDVSWLELFNHKIVIGRYKLADFGTATLLEAHHSSKPW